MSSHSEQAIRRFYHDYCYPNDYNLEAIWKKNLGDKKEIKKKMISLVKNNDRSTLSTFKYYVENILEKEEEYVKLFGLRFTEEDIRKDEEGEKYISFKGYFSFPVFDFLGFYHVLRDHDDDDDDDEDNEDNIPPLPPLSPEERARRDEEYRIRRFFPSYQNTFCLGNGTKIYLKDLFSLFAPNETLEEKAKKAIVLNTTCEKTRNKLLEPKVYNSSMRNFILTVLKI